MIGSDAGSGGTTRGGVLLDWWWRHPELLLDTLHDPFRRPMLPHPHPVELVPPGGWVACQYPGRPTDANMFCSADCPGCRLAFAVSAMSATTDDTVELRNATEGIRQHSVKDVANSLIEQHGDDAVVIMAARKGWTR